ncbi:hypothetical protein [Pararhizobium gei]|uniref:hypothetical protein n=1 Tax=Pararhizobium gei TaxID=1395951 RepID=UPI0023DC68EB|nr:hypothetical protein [Rhizobium gei]
MATLVFILLIAAAVTPLAIVSRTRILSSSYNIRKVAFEFLAPDLSRLISLGYHNKTLLSPWQRCEQGDRVLYIHHQDQNGLIGLNSASGDLLRAGFVAMGYDDSQAQMLSLRAQHYREPEFSGEKPEADFDPKRAPFENLAEIGDFLPVGPVKGGPANAVFSVYNRTDSVSLAKAPPALKQQLLKPENAVFLIEGASSSMFALVTLAEFKAGQSQGFQSRIMLDNSFEDGKIPKIVEKEIGFGDLMDLRVPNSGTIPCEAPVQQLIGLL